jgi:isoamylase
MTDHEWETGFNRSITVRLSGDALTEIDEEGNRAAGDSLMLLLNANHEPLAFTLPVDNPGTAWEVVFDTAAPRQRPGTCVCCEGGEPQTVAARALVVLRRRDA